MDKDKLVYYVRKFVESTDICDCLEFIRDCHNVLEIRKVDVKYIVTKNPFVANVYAGAGYTGIGWVYAPFCEFNFDSEGFLALFNDNDDELAFLNIAKIDDVQITNHE